MSVQQNAGVVLPAACAVAASFDPALARSVGAAQGQAEVDPNIKRSRCAAAILPCSVRTRT